MDIVGKDFTATVLLNGGVSIDIAESATDQAGMALCADEAKVLEDFLRMHRLQTTGKECGPMNFHDQHNAVIEDNKRLRAQLLTSAKRQFRIAKAAMEVIARAWPPEGLLDLPPQLLAALEALSESLKKDTDAAREVVDAQEES